MQISRALRLIRGARGYSGALWSRRPMGGSWFARNRTRRGGRGGSCAIQVARDWKLVYVGLQGGGGVGGLVVRAADFGEDK